MRIKHTRFTALDALTIDKNDGHEIHAIAMRALGRRAANTLGSVDSKLMRLNEPTWLRLQNREYLAQARD